jgi:hypothetical protein
LSEKGASNPQKREVGRGGGGGAAEAAETKSRAAVERQVMVLVFLGRPAGGYTFTPSLAHTHTQVF